MYRILITTSFDAAHRLANYPGPCSRLHGHTYIVTGEWERDNLDRVGMALDMIELKKQLRSVVMDMDHEYLNKIRDLAKPTAENIAQLLFTRLSKKVPSGEFLHAVTIEETPGCSVRYQVVSGLLQKPTVVSPAELDSKQPPGPPTPAEGPRQVG